MGQNPGHTGLPAPDRQPDDGVTQADLMASTFTRPPRRGSTQGAWPGLFAVRLL